MNLFTDYSRVFKGKIDRLLQSTLTKVALIIEMMQFNLQWHA